VDRRVLIGPGSAARTSYLLAVYWHVHASGDVAPVWTASQSVGGAASIATYTGAAAFLLGSMHEPAWLESVRVEVAEDGAARIVVTVLSADPMIRRCLPVSVSKVPVRVVVAVPDGSGAAT